MTSVQLVQAYSLTSTALRTTLDAMIGNTWAATMLDLGPTSARRWVSSVVPLVEAARTESAINTNAYITASVIESLGRPPRRQPTATQLRQLSSGIRNGADIGNIYWRPVATARTYASKGYPLNEALQRGHSRARTLAATDVQLAKTAASRASIEGEERIVGYRRVLTGTESCGLCITASTQRYHTKELLPIHPGCDCSVVPIMGTEDPGRVINQAHLDEARAAGVEPVKTIVYEHNEYGPTLGVKGHHTLRSASAQKRPTLGGFQAGKFERGRAVKRPNWAEKLGAVETPVEVSSGPSDSNIAVMGHTPGPGVAYATSDGRLFYVEYPPDIGLDPKLRFDSAVHSRLNTLIDNERLALPRNMEGYDVIMSVQAPSVDELQLIQMSGRGVHVYADAGEGRIVHYHGEVHPQGVWHETGHSVMGRLNEMTEGVTNQDPTHAFEVAGEADRGYRIEGPSLLGFNGEPFPTAAAHPVLVDAGQTQLGQTFYGVTPYGASKPTEDWAETWRLAILNEQKGHIATHSLGTEAPEPIQFEEMFPNRAKYLIDLQNELDVEFPFSLDGELVDRVLAGEAGLR